MKNYYEIFGDKVYIYLTQGQIAVIDFEDLNLANSFIGLWCAHYDEDVNNYYVVGKFKENNHWKTIKLHRLLTNTKERNIFVDHKNHNTLDNTRNNLRPCTIQENNMNARPRKFVSSKYKGVNWHRGINKWVARIGFNGKRIALGCYDKEEEAALAYQNKAIELFGEFKYQYEKIS